MSEDFARDWTGSQAKCVMMCGGGSTRFAQDGAHKSMATLGGRPLLHHVISYWKAYTDQFVFVVKHGKQAVVEYATASLPDPQFVEPTTLRGIADGLLYAEPLVGERFIVVLGDCFCAGRFVFPGRVEAGIGVLRGASAAQLQRNYGVYLEADRIARVKEKPRTVDTDLCGLGFYFLNRGIFDAIRRTPPSSLRNEVEITDALQTFIDSGHPVKPVWLEGSYVNVTYRQDLDTVRSLLGASAEDEP